MNLIYQVKDRPKTGQIIVFAFQQLLAILSATILVPAIVGNGMSQSAALFGAGVGTLVYLLFTKFKSPVFLGSSFAFMPSMFAAFAGAATANAGFTGLLIGAICAGVVYVIISLAVKFAGVKWIDKLMPAVVIGPTVAIIGLSLAGGAVGNVLTGAMYDAANSNYVMDNPTAWLSLLCALVTIAVVVICSVFGKKTLKLIPFIIGIGSGYLLATIFTLIGIATGNDALKLIDFTAFQNMTWLPDFTFIKAFQGFGDIDGKYIITIIVAYVPVAFVVFAEHLADHKNLSTIIDQNLLEEPGLHRTLLGDGVGSIAGAFFGGCPNTTYGESIGCVAITGNASVITIVVAAGMCIVAAFLAPFTTFLATIPASVMGGVCVTLYGFIAVSGLKMLQKVDLGDNRNLFTASVILIFGIGGFCLKIGDVKLLTPACSLIMGILVHLLVSLKKDKPAEEPEKVEEKTEKTE
ncbi:MAG: uracil-xanthine permease [Clostridia bacterium]|nr:uracil-xanthine permease [Clostridia bacterium]MBQ3927722.1 uracil-xanthine permease [Clostridia bacterium]MBQ7727560.1 uracil-xanthine permease [Clostridia bacterium]